MTVSVTSLLGNLFAYSAVATAAAGAIIGVRAALLDSRQGLAWSRWLAYATAWLFTGATLVMEYALVLHDFTVSYVAEVGSVSTPAIVSVVSLWSALDGSILFWALILSVYAAVFAWRVRKGSPVLGGWALAFLHITAVFFGALVISAATPFAAVLPPPPDGPGPNALLQNHVLMAIHPPTLYLGYVGMAVPFAMAAAALLAGRLDAAWMRSLRAWSLWVWAFLTLGILLGGWWSYTVLGWGGYWAWDPVENASLLPWLTLTAALHSLIVTSRRRMFRAWTLALVMVSFLLTLLGTFMTRSGVFNSVHSFTQSPIGPIFLVFIAFTLIGTVLLLAFGLDKVDVGEGRPYEAVSRESGFLLNNLVLTVLMFTVLVGTLYPLINQAVTGNQVSLGEPYYEKVTLPLVVALLFLMGVGPALPWGRTSPARALSQLAPPLVGGAVLGLVSVPLGARGFWLPFTWAMSGFIAVVSLRELAAPVVARVRGPGDEALPLAVFSALSRSRRRVGAHLAHLGVALAAIAIAASSAHKLEDEVTIPLHETVTWQGYDLSFAGAEEMQQPHRVIHRATVIVERSGRELATLQPAVNHYRTMAQPLGTPAVLTRASEDLYLTAVRIEPSALVLRVYRQPMVVWLWVGGLLMFLGALVAAWPRAGSRARPVARKELA